MTQINDVFYGIDTSNLLLRKSWVPSLGSPPTDVTEGFLYIAEDAGDVDLGAGAGVESFEAGNLIIYKDGGWIKVGGSSGGVGVGGWILLTANTVLEPNKKYILDYSTGPAVAFDVTLPEAATPLVEGDEIVLAHIQGDIEDLSPNFPQIVRAPTSLDRIAELEQDMDIDVNYETTTLVFTNIGSIGWRVY